MLGLKVIHAKTVKIHKEHPSAVADKGDVEKTREGRRAKEIS